MSVRKGKCTNFGNCVNADSQKIVDVPDGTDFVCPECRRQLNPVDAQQSVSRSPILLLALLVVVIAGGAWFLLRHRSAGDGTPTGAKLILRLHGSNTIGAQLGPALAQAYLRRQGAQDVKTIPGKPDEVTVQGTLSGSPQGIEIAAHGSATAFTDLAAGKCDIGMSSRQIKPGEAASLSSLGDMLSPASEHILGLDGLAFIVNRTNAVSALSVAQLAGIFSGEIADWSAVSGRHGTIKLYSRDDKSGTYDTFMSLVLGSRKLASSAARIEDSRQLVEKVVADLDAIGFVGMPYADGSKAIAISDKGTRPLMPSRLTVATEDYSLSRRLYLYTPSNMSPDVRRFIEFALGRQGQDVVADSGFVSQNVNAERFAPPPGTPEYTRMTSGAQRLTLNFRFRAGSSELDNKALVDLDRVVSFISDLRYSGKDVMLFGFADSTGRDAANETLSKDRARTVSGQFEQRGLKAGGVTGFGSGNPIASNDTAEGREKNRRVEIWVKQQSRG
jgi:phosphate transport system substrate-binding protein